MNVPRGCKHRGRFKKDCCEILWNGTIVEHDGCVVQGGCDIIAYDDGRFYIIEIKGGAITSNVANRIIAQIRKCEEYYSSFIGHRKKSRLFVRCVGKKKKRFDSYAREKLKRAGIRIYDCQGSFDLNGLD